ncbi:hypothetical protein [Fimbriiglobus ruber]|uniref:Uncharacterized protein n=1 Tax=Fimbriiglobus ruber TaxID=1908690 RepID=A0A225EE39_9BACT|nr:hypothetical protein [Fimbriiglobus ruber]OWK46577.1 hypothetical protein FRUB_00276 [Fimbriiglobus ruber]
MSALANPEVGKFLNEHFVASFQKVGTFKIVGAAKQGGNVASYFCAPDGRVLHAVAGPVDAATFLREAKWVVDTTKRAIAESKGDGGKFKAAFRTAHADKLRTDTGLAVEAVTWDQPEAQDNADALTYRDPTGRPLAPKLPPPPIDGPDVRLTEAEFQRRQDAANAAPGARALGAKGGRRVVVNNQAVVHQLLAAHAMTKIEKVYGTVFENILGEKVSTKPVDVVTPFPWVDRAGNKVVR